MQTSQSRDENLSTEILLFALGFAFLVGAFSPRGLFPGTDSRFRKWTPYRWKYRLDHEQEETDNSPVTESVPASSFPFSRFSIVVGLVFALIVGLSTTPDSTVEGFFLGFAGGALITAGVSLFVNRRSAK